MPDREKVIEALRICRENLSTKSCRKCPYMRGRDGTGTCYPIDAEENGVHLCWQDLVDDAIALLKEQEPNKSHRKNGYWIEDAKTCPGAGLSNYVCSNCGKTGGTWIKHIAPGRTLPWCPFCGTKMSGKKVKYAE